MLFPTDQQPEISLRNVRIQKHVPTYNRFISGGLAQKHLQNSENANVRKASRLLRRTRLNMRNDMIWSLFLHRVKSTIQHNHLANINPITV